LTPTKILGWLRYCFRWSLCWKGETGRACPRACYFTSTISIIITWCLPQKVLHTLLNGGPAKVLPIRPHAC